AAACSIATIVATRVSSDCDLFSRRIFSLASAWEWEIEMSERSDSKHGHNGPDSYKLELVGLTADGERPKVVVQAIDAEGGAIHTEVVAADGRFALPADALKRADRVVLGAPDGKGGIKTE